MNLCLYIYYSCLPLYVVFFKCCFSPCCWNTPIDPSDQHLQFPVFKSRLLVITNSFPLPLAYPVFWTDSFLSHWNPSFYPSLSLLSELCCHISFFPSAFEPAIMSSFFGRAAPPVLPYALLTIKHCFLSLLPRPHYNLYPCN